MSEKQQEQVVVKASGGFTFDEISKAHPGGRATVTPQSGAVTVALTEGVQRALDNGQLKLAAPKDAVSATTETVETEELKPDEEA